MMTHVALHAEIFQGHAGSACVFTNEKEKMKGERASLVMLQISVCPSSCARGVDAYKEDRKAGFTERTLEDSA